MRRRGKARRADATEIISEAVARAASGDGVEHEVESPG
jgi:hypothetical protein